jgi:hypothetical protein
MWAGALVLTRSLTREPVPASLENAMKSCGNLYHAMGRFWVI